MNPSLAPEIGTTVNDHNCMTFYFEFDGESKCKCNYCEAVFKFRYLDSYTDKNELNYDICPVCGEYDPCDLEFETMNETLRRIQITKDENTGIH